MIHEFSEKSGPDFRFVGAGRARLDNWALAGALRRRAGWLVDAGSWREAIEMLPVVSGSSDV